MEKYWSAENIQFTHDFIKMKKGCFCDYLWKKIYFVILLSIIQIIKENIRSEFKIRKCLLLEMDNTNLPYKEYKKYQKIALCTHTLY